MERMEVRSESRVCILGFSAYRWEKNVIPAPITKGVEVERFRSGCTSNQKIR